jgi:hypothetical protein
MIGVLCDEAVRSDHEERAHKRELVPLPSQRVLKSGIVGRQARSDADRVHDAPERQIHTRLLARNSLGLATVHVSATDSRRDPNSVPANEPLWSNVVSFTF